MSLRTRSPICASNVTALPRARQLRAFQRHPGRRCKWRGNREQRGEVIFPVTEAMRSRLLFLPMLNDPGREGAASKRLAGG